MWESRWVTVKVESAVVIRNGNLCEVLLFMLLMLFREAQA